MSGFKSFSQNTTSHANVTKAQVNEHSEVIPPAETETSPKPASENDQSANNEQPDPNNK
ncbi:hypothetical protein F895_02622 [Acinetobacter sp. CIP 64.2]|uniref:hypothetical protein n=1 Tax=Acinetobacter sp. CIP 64.2 TaxID=1217694 RepID=UPI000289A2FA|nr:hypothetical protein [Acinetobacter sp. CIP 64.2]ENX13318.1 hypothetical protein F895_02622 [Acinetobacter sp. CIP 64.2]